jgi:hypothetical protein
MHGMLLRRITIGEAASRCGLSRTTLRSLDRKGILSPRRDYTGRRVYTENEISQLLELAGLVLEPDAAPRRTVPQRSTDPGGAAP